MAPKPIEMIDIIKKVEHPFFLDSITFFVNAAPVQNQINKTIPHIINCQFSLIFYLCFLKFILSDKDVYNEIHFIIGIFSLINRDKQALNPMIINPAVLWIREYLPKILHQKMETLSVPE